MFNGKIFKINLKNTNYQQKDKIKRIVYKCANNRKNELLREKLKKGSFCNATIEYIYPDQGVKSGFFLKEEHSIECISLDKHEEKKQLNLSKDKEKFIEACENIMNSSNIYDRRLFKEEFKKIYNECHYNFPISNT